MGCHSSKKKSKPNEEPRSVPDVPAKSESKQPQNSTNPSRSPPLDQPVPKPYNNHFPVSGSAAYEPMRAQPLQPVPPPVSENVDVEDTSHALPYPTSIQAKPSANGSLPSQSRAAFPLDKKVERNNEGLFFEPRLDHYDPSKSITLTIRDFEATFTFLLTLTLNKSTESLYTEVRQYLNVSALNLIYEGKVLPEDSTALGAYGVLESGTLDCLFLSPKA